jgi:hypothetical protein
MKPIQKLWQKTPGVILSSIQNTLRLYEFTSAAKKLVVLTLVITLSVLTSCENDDPVNTNDVKDDESSNQIVSINDKEISGTKLVQMNFDNDSFISFWELSPGNIGIRVSKHQGDEKQSTNSRISAVESTLDNLIKSKKSVVEIYNAIAPVPDRKEIALLRSAMTRRDEAKQKEVGDITRPEEKESGSLNTSLSSDNSRVAACSPDYYGDAYSANWFLNNFCVEGAYRFCPTNIAWAYSGLRRTTWFKTSAMAADFNEGTQFLGFYWTRTCFIFCGNWYQVPLWNYTVLPRRVESWYIYSEYAESSVNSNCRAHFSALWYE